MFVVACFLSTRNEGSPALRTPAVKVLVLGAQGQVGYELCGVLACLADVVGLDLPAFDITDADALRAAIRTEAPDVIVNAAAYTDVDGAEKEPHAAMRVNADAMTVLGEEARQQRIALVHYSTDFVFNGRSERAYREEDQTEPLNHYGRTKLAGERALFEQQAPAIVLRTAWVYSVRKKSFVSTILKLARERKTLQVVCDQIGNPTFCRDLAHTTALVIYGARRTLYEVFLEASGIYHLAGSGHCSRLELAKTVVSLDPRKQEHVVEHIEPVTTDQYPLPARRPARAVLDCTKFHDRFGIRLPHWQESLARALSS